MKKLYASVLLISILMLSSFSGQATHMFAGNFEWTCINPDTFLIKLTIYRDCNGIQLSTASIPIKCASTGATITTINILKPAPIDVTPVCGASCTRCVTSSCSFPWGIEKYVFIKQVVLNNSTAGSCCKIKMSFSSASRSSGITTGAATANFYIEAILNRCLSPCDNSPSFTEDPLSILCIGQDFRYNSGAFDVDTNSSGIALDSISYEWGQPLQGGNNPISYSGQYNYGKPIYFWGFPDAATALPRGYHLDKSNGDISFRPMKIERTVAVLKVKEWRKINGSMLLIGETSRDMQWIVMSCSNNNAPVLGGTYNKQVYANDTINFNFYTNDYDTKDTLHISWNKSIQSAIWTDNNDSVKHPTGNLYWIPDSSDIGTHMFMVTVKDDACPVNGKSTRAFHIIVCQKETGDISITNNGCGNYTFDVINSPANGLTYSWSNNNRPTKTFTKRYNNQGIYYVTLDISSSCGMKSYTDSFYVPQFNLYCELPNDTLLCKADSLPITASIYNNKGNTRFWWSNGDSTNLTIKPYINGDNTFYFTVEDSTGCQHTDSIQILLDEISLSMSNDVLKCPDILSKLQAFFNPDEGSSFSYQWSLASSPYVISNKQFLDVFNDGKYVCKVSDNLGCYLRDTIEVSNYTVPTVNAGSDENICSGNTLFKLNTGSPSNLSHRWTGPHLVFISGAYYFDVSKGLGNGVDFHFNYEVTDLNGCITIDTKKLTLYETPPTNAGAYSDRCINSTTFKLNGYPFGGTWSGSGIENTNYFNPSKAGFGYHQLLYSVNNKGCIGIDTSFILVFNFDTSQFYAKTEYNITKFCHEYNLVKLIGNPVGGCWTGPITNGNYFNAASLNGAQHFEYSYTDQNNCNYSKNLEITIGHADVAINRNDNIICSDEKLSINATPKFVSGVKWIKSPLSDGTYIGSITSNYIKYISGINDKINKGYWLHIKTTDPVCKEVLDSVFIAINEVQADFSVDTTSGSAPLNIYFTDKSTSHAAAISSWLWDFGDNSFSWDKSPFHSYKDTGYFNVGLRIISSENCSDSILKKDFILSMHNVSISEPDESQIMVYPNPTDKELIIKFVNSNMLINSVSLLNLEGKILDRYAANSQSEIHIQAINQPSGFYFLKIEATNGISYYRKITIIK
ncbi:MAG: T9SS type A sorting domain-containing protein [Bacteroidetes bacterium]|jgi:PKD repeat protein|nr:T9SS type A sorting domain-containing protein [Bacteroidota bacterium]MBT4727946.1 T9SS type A sorting domain-containing protein [Bacteroidota bacterium]MBT6835181.1 T9SS type A sorting domain-containing protein [Bacteroidota bacterium]MBT7994707.1 T9SS type A sorting domain-containing protein [Bacteroidota bacterium]